MAEWLHTNSSSENSAAARKTFQMNDGDRMRKRKRVEGSGISGLLSTFTAPKLVTYSTDPSIVPKSIGMKPMSVNYDQI